MGSFLEHTTRALAAFGVAALSLSAPAALAQSSDTPIMSESGYPVLTDEEALEQSAGRVLLHVGEGYSPVTLQLNIDRLEEAGMKVEVASGGPENGITSYFFGNHFPSLVFTEETSTEMVVILIKVAQEHNLIAIPSRNDP